MSGTPAEVGHPYVVVFGAAVRPDGGPSPSLRRRVEGAVRTARSLRDPRYLVTGGVGRYGPAEAALMKDLLVGLGVPADAVVMEDQATDTLDSVDFCTRILERRGDVDQVFACSDRFHIPRCRILFRLFGVPALAGEVDSGRASMGTPKWIYYWLRECAAIPWDMFLAMFRR